jgi:hypothetical protein
MSRNLRLHRALVGALVLMISCWCAGCGKGAEKKPDGGGMVTIPDALAGGRHAFDVTAFLSGVHDADASGLPATNRFTLVLDADARIAIAGGNGRGAVIGVTTDDGRTFRSAGTFSVGDVSGSACGGPADVSYATFELTIDSFGRLTGTAAGSATISCGDCSFQHAFAATLSGTADATPPTLRAAGFPPQTPFDPFSLVVSEPLPASATARLVADDGAGVDLLPTIIAGDVPLVVGFTKPDVVLRAGQGYVATVDGLVDFAGLTPPSDPPLRLTSFVDAPLVPEDGFESATGSSLGGAMVTKAGGALPVVSGNTSLYIGAPGTPGLDASNGRSLMVKLARQAGDTKVRFAYRVVAVTPPPLIFFGTMRVGSEGGGLADPLFQIDDMGAGTETMTIAGKSTYVSLGATRDLPLPDDAAGEVLFVIAPSVVQCFPGGRSAMGLLIDDLRLE